MELNRKSLVDAWSEVKQRGCEGLVAKDESSLYVGGRTLSWLKVKQAKYRVSDRGFQLKGIIPLVS